MKKLVNLIQQVVLELVLLPFNICVLALAILDYHEIADLDRRKSIGEVIVYINLIVPILSLALMAAKAIVMAVDFYKSWKLAKANKIKKLASVQKNFRPNDLLNTTEEQQLQTQPDASSPSKSSVDHNQTLNLTDQFLLPLEHHSVRSTYSGNPIISKCFGVHLVIIMTIGPLRSNFMANNYYQQNSIPMTSQNAVMPEYQNDFQQQQQPQFTMGIMQEEIIGHSVMPPQNHRSKQK